MLIIIPHVTVHLFQGLQPNIPAKNKRKKKTFLYLCVGPFINSLSQLGKAKINKSLFLQSVFSSLMKKYLN